MTTMSNIYLSLYYECMLIVYEKLRSVMLLGLTAERSKICEFLSTPWPQVIVSWIEVGENSDQVTSILRSKADRLKNTLL